MATILRVAVVLFLALAACSDDGGEGSSCDPDTFISYCVDTQERCKCNDAAHKVECDTCENACYWGGYTGGHCETQGSNPAKGGCVCY
jgi:hypothetical protein